MDGPYRCDDQLRQSVGLRAYGQNNPLVEYQTEGYNMFEDMVGAIEYEVTRLFMKAEIRQNVQREQVAQGEAQETETVPEEYPSFKNVGRNDPCPCGQWQKIQKLSRQKIRRIDTLGKRLAAFLVQPFPFIYNTREERRKSNGNRRYPESIESNE